MRGLKKIIIVLFIIAAVVAGALWYGYYRVIPKIVGEAIISDTEPSVLPAPYKAKIARLKKPVNRATEKLLHEVDSLNIPFTAILRLIDETENEDVVRAIEELQSKKPTTTDAVFNIVKKNIPSKEFDLELFRKSFLKYATMERYHYGMKYIEKNEVIEQIDEMPYREIMKEVLLQKRAEIDRKLRESGGPKLN